MENEITTNSGMVQGYDIVPPHLAVKAMQDNGYKNPAYAVAELIDNSIQAKASSIELLCLEEANLVSERQRSRLKNLAVLDNGIGMDEKTLRMALQFGNGSYLDYKRHTGIGRFGMGLPCSSISQAQKVEVWSWQDGHESALYCYLDVDEITRMDLRVVPPPERKPIPAVWRTLGKTYEKTGTLVIWSEMRRCVWRTSRTLIDNSEFLIGRIYRKFIADDRVRIRMAAFDSPKASAPFIERFALPNDPLYLMQRTSCPAPFSDKPMFEQWGDDRRFVVNYRNANHKIIVRFALAKKEAREVTGVSDAGRTEWGKHAERNIGVSIVRAGRELDLDPGWAIRYDPRERWWGVELEFPPGLDDLFGVTNNKQAAHHFSELAKIDIDDLLRDGRTIHQLMDEWNEDGDPRAPLLEVAQAIQKGIRALRESIKEQRRGARAKRRHDQIHVEQIATAATNARKEGGHRGLSDCGEVLPKDERVEAITEDLTQDGTTRSEAEIKAAQIVDNGLKYEFVEASLESPAFFSVRAVAGVLKVTLNTTHPAYEKLVEVLEEDLEGASAEELRERLLRARDGLKLLLTAWARYEDEQPDGPRRDLAQDARTDWGRVARDFLKHA